MYLTMNRFKVKLGHEDEFEEVWANRESQLTRVSGFRSFHLMKGEEREGYRLYASHTVWDSEAAFRAWTRSEAFRVAHQGAGNHRDMYMGAPVLEVFESVQSVEA
jgi:heme-degrading monooxygenase HmoA